MLTTLQKCLFNHPDPPQYLIGYSGGRDSGALLHAVSMLVPKEKILAVHVHHGLQPAADDFESHTQFYAASLGIAYQCVRVSIEGTHNLEARARDARYEALRRALLPGGMLFTAHHQEDQALSVFMALLRGSGIEGLAGMGACVSFGSQGLGYHARPWLEIAPEVIEAYVQEHQIPVIEDPSNEHDVFLRNRMRQHLVPLLREHFPNMMSGMVQSALHVQSAKSLLDEWGTSTLQALKRFIHCAWAGICAQHC